MKPISVDDLITEIENMITKMVKDDDLKRVVYKKLRDYFHANCTIGDEK